MAYLSATALSEYRHQYSASNLDKAENRGSGFGLLSLAKRDTLNLISPQTLISARGTAARTTKVPVLQKISYSPGSTRSCTGATQDTTSALSTVSWTTITSGFHMVPSQYDNNEIAYVEDFKQKLFHLERAWAVAIDTAIYTALNAAKSTTYTATDSPYAFTSNVIQIPNGDKGTYLNELYQSMYQDDFTGPFNIVASPQLMAVNSYFGNQGAGNSVNTMFQFGEFQFDFSNRVSLSTGAHSTFFIMPTGSLAILDWIDPDSRANRRLSETNYWTNFNMPMLGMTAGLHVQMACADNASTYGSGLEASVTENYNFSMDYAIITPYISAGAVPIFKADILAL
jgi:hypothetical protein